MTRQSRSAGLTINSWARAATLRRAVRHALCPPQACLRALVAAGLVLAAVPPAHAAPFPAVFPLATLLNGDGRAGFVLAGVTNNSHSGNAVSRAGDVNGDGIDDLIIGAHRARQNQRDEAGAAFVVFGSTQGFPGVMQLASLFPPHGGDGSAGFVLAGIDDDDRAGELVSAAGDVNGDGIDDVIVGAKYADPGGRDRAGEAYVVFGSTHGFPAVLRLASLLPSGGGNGRAGFVLTGIDENDRVGESVSAAGDVNGDGIDDLIIGARLADPDGRSEAGESYVVFGSTAGFPPVLPLASLFPAGGGNGTVGFVLTGANEDDASGLSVGGAGDINHDGIDDVIVGAERAHAGFVLFGAARGFPAVLPLESLLLAGGGDGRAGFVLTGIEFSLDPTGLAVAAAGDVNGDGVDDLIVGADRASPDGRLDAGESYVIYGSTQPFPAEIPVASLSGGDGSTGFVLAGIDELDFSSKSASGASDVNGDGVADLIIGAYFAFGGGQPFAGESYVVFGSTQGFPAVLPLESLLPGDGGDGSVGFVLPGIDAYDSSGYAVSGAGDINGDGIDDVIIGASQADAGDRYGAGESYVVFGRPGSVRSGGDGAPGASE